MSLRQVFRFGLIGGVATLTHIVTGTSLIEMGVLPLLANLVAFSAAFAISFLGHKHFSFRDQRRGSKNPFLRFAIVAILGVVANTCLLAILIGVFPDKPSMSLVLSSLSVAGGTYWFARSWVFANVRQKVSE